jgi:hypothetical protein
MSSQSMKSQGAEQRGHIKEDDRLLPSISVCKKSLIASLEIACEQGMRALPTSMESSPVK